MTTLVLGNRRLSTFLPVENAQARIHRFWWTALPAIPYQKNSRAYARLMRQFADHTMNTIRMTRPGLWKPSSNRGAYRESTEDHLTPAFFENFTLFPDKTWLLALLGRLEIPVTGLREASWSYSFEQGFRGSLQTRVDRNADVVVHWRDNHGEAVLVFEVKSINSSRKIEDKDLPSSKHYLKFEAFRSISRRYQALVLDADHLARLRLRSFSESSVLTWQELAALQQLEASRLAVPAEISERIVYLLAAHHSCLGIERGGAEIRAEGTLSRYDEISRFAIPETVRDWLVGAECFFAARANGFETLPPYEWLSREWSILDLGTERGPQQSRLARRQQLWRLNTQPLR